MLKIDKNGLNLFYTTGCVGVCWGVLGCAGVCWGVLGCAGCAGLCWVCWGV